MEFEFGRLSLESDLLIKVGSGVFAFLSGLMVAIAVLKNRVDRLERDVDYAFKYMRGEVALDLDRKEGDKKK